MKSRVLGAATFFTVPDEDPTTGMCKQHADAYDAWLGKPNKLATGGRSPISTGFLKKIGAACWLRAHMTCRRVASELHVGHKWRPDNNLLPA
jgi:hypothetical protein